MIVRFLPDDVRQLSGDAVVATDCWTAYPAAATRFKERFYLIQDYEPELRSPIGSRPSPAGIWHIRRTGRSWHATSMRCSTGSPNTRTSIRSQKACRRSCTAAACMHFYSDNNSAMARSVWKEIPYPEVDWGEDAVWAWGALQAGSDPDRVLTD